MRHAFICIVLLFALTACKHVSKYPINEKADIPIDSKLLGMWRAVEDTVKDNFFLVQNNSDVHDHLEGYKFGTYDIYNNNYYITYFDKHGLNPHYAQWGSFMSKVNGINFLNIGDQYSMLNGYLLIRIVNISDEGDKAIIATVNDTTLKYLGSSKEVRKYVRKHINNVSFYKDTMHLYKIDTIHYYLQDAIRRNAAIK